MIKNRLSKNALQVLESRYLRRNSQRQVVETSGQLFERVAQAIAYAELLVTNAQQSSYWEEQFHEMLTSLDFLPNSPTLMNAGTTLGQLSACFVIPVGDTIEEIFEAVKQVALVQRTGGGTGFDFSHLRPQGEAVSSTGGEASGPVSFMKIFDCATDNIKQGGRRRGANMGVLRADHPDIMDFVAAKLDGTSLQNFNISVGVTDRFMEAVHSDDEYELIEPRTGRPVKKIKAKKIFDAIAESAWQVGDPGLLFLDKINASNPTPNLGALESTNPCGEIPLLPYESCNLGSINLANMVDLGHPLQVNWPKLRSTVRKAIRFLDDVIEVNNYPLPEIDAVSRGNRKIGLGVMGFAEMLIYLGISYASKKAIEFAQNLIHVISDEALKASQELAQERGVFPNWKGSIYERKGIKLRNAARLAIAPTGTISIIAGTSPSIEPLFALAYRKAHVLEGQTLYEPNPIFLKYLKDKEIETEGILEQVLHKGNLKELERIPQNIKRLFITALEISPEKHIQIQASFQHYVDNSVSKTINMPEDTSCKDIAKTYMRAWELGLKGITVYRYGSKSAQVLELGTDEEADYIEHTAQCDPHECKL